MLNLRCGALNDVVDGLFWGHLRRVHPALFQNASRNTFDLTRNLFHVAPGHLCEIHFEDLSEGLGDRFGDARCGVPRTFSRHPVGQQADFLLSILRGSRTRACVGLLVGTVVDPRILPARFNCHCAACQWTVHRAVTAPCVLFSECAESNPLLDVSEIVVDNTKLIVPSHPVTIDHLAGFFQKRIVGHVRSLFASLDCMRNCDIPGGAESIFAREEPEVVVFDRVQNCVARVAVRIPHLDRNRLNLQACLFDRFILRMRLCYQSSVGCLHLGIVRLMLHRFELIRDASGAIRVNLSVVSRWIVGQTRFSGVVHRSLPSRFKRSELYGPAGVDLDALGESSERGCCGRRIWAVRLRNPSLISSHISCEWSG